MKENETLEDLQYKGYKILQKKGAFKFGVDAVLAAYYAESDIRPGHKILDMGTGTGIIAILIAARTKASHITGMEIQSEIADMALRSVKLNNLESRVSIVIDDIAHPKNISPGYYDHVVTNPPYKKKGSGIVNPGDSKAISRHEILCTLEDVISLAAKSLKPNGFFTMVNRPERLCDSMELMRKYKIEPKTVRFVHPVPSRSPSIMLIKGVKFGNPYLKVEPPLYIFDEENNYTREINDIYNRE